MQDPLEAYRAASGEEIARLHGQIDSLTEEAQKSLLSEIARRGMSENELLQIRNQWAIEAAISEREWRKARNVDAPRTLRGVLIRAVLVIAAASLGVFFVLKVFGH